VDFGDGVIAFELFDEWGFGAGRTFAFVGPHDLQLWRITFTS
jgi:hypothetical protein